MTEESIIAALVHLKEEPAFKKLKSNEIRLLSVGSCGERKSKRSRANASRRNGHWNKDLLMPLISLISEEIALSDNASMCSASSDAVGYLSEGSLSSMSASHDSQDDF